MSERKITGWFTMNGKHVPIFDGESKEDAVKRSVANNNEDIKNKQIAQAQAERDARNKAVGKVVQKMSEKLGKKPSSSDNFSENDKKFIKDMIKEATSRVPAHDNFTADDLIRDNGVEKTVKEYVKQFGGDESKILGAVKSNIAKQLSDSREKKGVTRKDVEELTAKANALKGVKLNAKPISQSEIDAQKKQWGGDKPQMTESVKKSIDSLSGEKLKEYAKSNEALLKKVTEEYNKSTNPTDKAWYKGFIEKYSAIKEYLDSKTGSDVKSTMGFTTSANVDLKNNSAFRETLMDLKNPNNIKGSIRIAESLSPEDRKQFVSDFKAYLKSKYPELDYSVSMADSKKDGGVWLKLKNNAIDKYGNKKSFDISKASGSAVRKNLEGALQSIVDKDGGKGEYWRHIGTLSGKLDYGFNKSDLLNLGNIFAKGNPKINDAMIELLTDCNFHSEARLLNEAMKSANPKESTAFKKFLELVKKEY